ncbi:MAG: hypothetical protein JXR96_25930 [Deltaproteobacteria bacterium]|nr:hypothetical protein [Deltaproteobacteria bacterium]
MRFLERAALTCASLLLFACSSGTNGSDGGVDGDGGGGTDEGPRACESTAECPLHHLCIGGFCQPGDACSASDDSCPDGYACNFLQEVCVPENPCTSDTDCTESATPHCLIGDGVCVECTLDAHCGDPESFFCNASYQCEAVGPDCTGDPDCTEPDKPHCGLDGKCYACVTNDHCEGTWVCQPTRHVCVECYLPSHCVSASLPFCYDLANVCVECLDDMHCLAEEHCNLSSHECTDVICETDNDCPPGLHCKQDSGDCVQCLDHGQCGSNHWCRDYSCQSGCLSDEDCLIKEGENHYCDFDPVDPRCFFAECREDGDCVGDPDGAHCKLDDYGNADQFSCVECTEDGHCDTYFECERASNTCRAVPCFSRPEGDQCPDLPDCYFCDYDGECKPRGTSTSHHPDNTCYDENNDPDDELCCRGYECNSMGHCEVVDYCEQDDDCPVGWTCADYYQCTQEPCCDPPCNAGEFCNSDCECESGCHEEGEACTPFESNCCEGLYCSFFPPVCKPL